MRAHDHRIMLKPDAQPVAVRPYRYPAAHKDELERQCAAMMEQGIVRRSDSPFSSPVLLVKKPNGSWRFCVDYRALNARTVKDAFPIPVVDELLDELHGAQFFTKLKPRFVGPYKVTEVVNEVAVRLELPPDARLHDVFHVGVLKKFVGSPPAAPPALPPLSNGAVVPAPSRVTQGRLARGVRQVLVEWEGHDPAAASWEDLDDFRTRFPSFQLEDELDFEAGRDVMCGRVYARRRRARDIRRAAERASQARNAPSEAGHA